MCREKREGREECIAYLLSFFNESSKSSVNLATNHQVLAMNEDDFLPKVCRVVVGNERWMTKNGVTVDEAATTILVEEQAKGHIAVLCAINGNYFSVSLTREQTSNKFFLVFS